MSRYSALVCGAMLLLGSCRLADSTGTQAPTGQYDWSGVDGIRGSCCERDSAGVSVTVVHGLLDLGYNSGIGRYDWDWIQDYRYPDGTLQSVQTTFSAGTYTWDGKAFAFSDTLGLGIMAGYAAPGQVTIEVRGHQYEFLKLPRTR
jgi:hypothetical protein